MKISKRTLLNLEKLRDELKADNLDQTIGVLVRRYRSEVLSSAFGVDKGRIKPFAEEDRVEEREPSR